MKRKRLWTISGHGDGSKYRTALHLWGEYRIHLFWRGDLDRTHHDHPNDFWTFPFVGYWKEVTDRSNGEVNLNYVKPWRWHFREAEYRHRVIGRSLYHGKFLTLILQGKDRRKWGFWPDGQFVYWRDYIGGNYG